MYLKIRGQRANDVVRVFNGPLETKEANQKLRQAPGEWDLTSDGASKGSRTRHGYASSTTATEMASTDDEHCIDRSMKHVFMLTRLVCGTSREAYGVHARPFWLT